MASKKNITQVIDEARCAGCWACANVCPTMALDLRENADGFMMPKVDASLCIACGKCVEVCPALRPESGNSPKPAIYAFRAADELRAGSSSGAFFPVVARHILEQGGVVCGAAFDASWHLRHTLAETWEEVQPMRGSKYVYSDAGLIYKKIADMLKHGRKVLFTGTPCQVAALQAVLGHKDPHLLTVDLLCHGTPPQKLLRKRIAEINPQGEISAIKFRDKRYGWGCSRIRIETDSGLVYENLDDPYYIAFHQAMSLRKSCGVCPFSEFPRQGDLSMGDFWGYEKFPEIAKDGKGTSLIFANNEKGERVLAELLSAGNYGLRIETELKNIGNRITRWVGEHKSRGRFLELAKHCSLAEAYNYAYNDKYDCGCVGNFPSSNFGGTLTYFAFYNVLEDLGQRTLMVPCVKASAWARACIDDKYEPDSFPPWSFASGFRDEDDLRALNKKCANFVTGSDQQFIPHFYKHIEGYVAQDWVESSKRKIVFATSFGHDKVDYEPELKEELSYFLKRFDAFSVREKSGVALCRDYFGIKAEQVLDPVFLCARRHYERLASLSREQNDGQTKFLCAYILDAAEDKQKLIEDVCAAKSINYRLYPDWDTKTGFRLALSAGKMNKRLLDIMDSAFVITDSFHGVCFAIIFHKPFIAWANYNRGYARFQSILEDAGLMDRMIHNIDEYRRKKDELLQPIDYAEVEKRLKPLKEYSLDWLRKTLAAPHADKIDDYDIVMRKMRSGLKELKTELKAEGDKPLTDAIEKLRQELKADSEKLVTAAMERLRTELACKPEKTETLAGKVAESQPACPEPASRIMDDIHEYLAHIYKELDKLIVIIAAKDTPCGQFEHKLAADMARIGLCINLDGQFRKSYLAIVDGGAPVVEQISDEYETLAFAGSVGGLNISVMSSSFMAECMASIKIDNSEVAVNGRGLNFVLIDKDTLKVRDSVCFDMFVPEIPATRL